ncbi:MAG: ankyrin repeat domain-containing protein [Candidatus Hydrogenedentes bacterium]|nr:ankyrin repeat domain-containing protein [Candidatus Hydrogenedentota bacterium]
MGIRSFKETWAFVAIGLVLAGCSTSELVGSVKPGPPPGVSWRLHALVHNGDLDGVKQAIADGADVNALEPDEWHQTDHCIGVPSFTPLQVAVWDSNTEIARYLLKCGANVNISTRDVPNLLELALHRENLELVTALLDSGANGNFTLRDRNGETPLTLAYEERNTALISALIEHGVDVDYPNASGFNVLSIAALTGKTKELDAMIRLGANVNAAIPTPPLRAAAHAGQVDAVRFLIEHGADPNAVPAGCNALVAAARGGHADVVKVLIDSGANIAARDTTGRTVLTVAEMSGLSDDALAILLRYAQAETDLGDGDTPVRMAIRHGVSSVVVAFARDNPALLQQEDAGESILYYALKNEQNDIADLLAGLGATPNLHAADGEPFLTALAKTRVPLGFQFLIEHGADTSVRDKQGRTLLSNVVTMKYAPAQYPLAALLEVGVDVNVPDGDGGTPLEHAISESNAETAKLLLEHGADVALPGRYGHLPIGIAVSRGNVDLVELLLEFGATFEQRDALGDTALIAAVRNKQTGMARYLLEKQVDLEARNAIEGTALSEAAAGGSTECAALLLLRGANVNTRSQRGMTPLMLALCTGIYSDSNIYRLLMDSGARIDDRNKNGETALMHAARNAPVAILNDLIARGADPLALNNTGATALMYAARGGRVENVRRLIESGVEVNAADSEGRTSLHWAVAGFAEHVQWCDQNLRHGREGDARNYDSHRDRFASSFVEVVRLLLSEGVDATIRNKDGYAPYDLAKEGHLAELSQLLIVSKNGTARE